MVVCIKYLAVIARLMHGSGMMDGWEQGRAKSRAGYYYSSGASAFLPVG